MEPSSSGDSGKRGRRERPPGVAPIHDGAPQANPQPNPAQPANGRQDPSLSSTSDPAPRTANEMSNKAYLKNRIELLEKDNYRFLIGTDSARTGVQRHLPASHLLANSSQNPPEDQRQKYELELAHQEILRLRREAEKQGKGEVKLVPGAEVPQLQHENKLLAENIAALKKETKGNEKEFRERNDGLNRKLNTALAENGELKKKVEDLEGKVEELEEKKHDLVKAKDRQIAELQKECDSKNAEMRKLKEEKEQWTVSANQQVADGRAELEVERRQLQQGQEQLRVAEQAFSAQQRQMEEHLANGQAVLEAERRQLQQGQEQLRVAEQSVSAQQREVEDHLANDLAVLEAERRQLLQGQEQLRVAEQAVSAQQRQVDEDRILRVEERTTLLAGQIKLADGERQLEEACKKLTADQGKLQEDQKELAANVTQLEKDRENLDKDREDYNNFLNNMLAEYQTLKEKEQLFHETMQKDNEGLEDQRKEIRVVHRQLIIDVRDYHAKFGELEKEKVTVQRKVEVEREKHAAKVKELEDENAALQATVTDERGTSDELRNIIDGLMDDLENEKEIRRSIESDYQSLHQAQELSRLNQPSIPIQSDAELLEARGEIEELRRRLREQEASEHQFDRLVDEFNGLSDAYSRLQDG
ncbi:unnamed protein product [Caenorhabditis brenneri]